MELWKGCEVGKGMLLRGARQLVQEAHHRPMLTSKSCDGTPITVTRRESHTQPSGKKVKTQGKQCHEFLVGNQFLRLPDGPHESSTKVLLWEPTILTRGKTAAAILAASRRHWW